MVRHKPSTRCRLFWCATSCPLPPPSSAGPRGRTPTVSLHEVSNVQGCRLRPVFPFVTLGRAVRLGPPQCHGTRCRLFRCAVSSLFLSRRHPPGRGITVGQPTVSWHKVLTVRVHHFKPSPSFVSLSANQVLFRPAPSPVSLSQVLMSRLHGFI